MVKDNRLKMEPIFFVVALTIALLFGFFLGNWNLHRDDPIPITHVDLIVSNDSSQVCSHITFKDINGRYNNIEQCAVVK